MIILKIILGICITFIVLISFMELAVIGAAVLDIKQLLKQIQDDMKQLERMVNNFDTGSNEK